MSADIGPGDFVECVQVVNPQLGHGLNIGSVCVVERVHVLPDETGLDLVGVKKAPGGVGWNIEAFRPIYRPKPGAFDQLLKAPKREEQTA